MPIIPALGGLWQESCLELKEQPGLHTKGQASHGYTETLSHKRKKGGLREEAEIRQTSNIAKQTVNRCFWGKAALGGTDWIPLKF